MLYPQLAGSHQIIPATRAATSSHRFPDDSRSWTAASRMDIASSPIPAVPSAGSSANKARVCRLTRKWVKIWGSHLKSYLKTSSQVGMILSRLARDLIKTYQGGKMSSLMLNITFLYHHHAAIKMIGWKRISHWTRESIFIYVRVTTWTSLANRWSVNASTALQKWYWVKLAWANSCLMCSLRRSPRFPSRVGAGTAM